MLPARLIRLGLGTFRLDSEERAPPDRYVPCLVRTWLGIFAIYALSGRSLVNLTRNRLHHVIRAYRLGCVEVASHVICSFVWSGPGWSGSGEVAPSAVCVTASGSASCPGTRSSSVLVHGAAFGPCAHLAACQVRFSPGNPF